MRKRMPIPSKRATVSEVVEFYLCSDQFCKLTGNVQKKYEQQLNIVLETVVERKALGLYRARNLKARHTNLAYQEWLKSGPHTANYRKAVLSTAWRHSMRLDVMENDPVRLIKTVSTQPRKVKWTREQVTTFLNMAYSEFKWRSIGLIVHMSYEWAQRIGDMRMLTWDKIDFDAQRMDLTQSKRGADVHLPIDDGLFHMLKQQQQDFGFQQYVAPRPYPVAGSYIPYAEDKIDNAITEVKQAAGLPKEITAMDLRRTAITEMVEAGVDLAQIMMVSGHRSPDSVRPYMVNTFSGASNALAMRKGKANAED
jgi:integrase